MLTTPRSQFVEKIITSPEGIDFKVVFLVYEENGKVKGHFVSATPVSAPAQAADEHILALGGKIEKNLFFQIFEKIEKKVIPSPYSSLLYFKGSIPRAPAF